MKTFNPQVLSLGKLQSLLTYCVAPRPIAFASTIDIEGNHNLSPFSFFNIFSNNPPILVFSPARRVRDNTTKHTYQNIKEVPQVVINMVNYNMVQQTSLASTEYAKGVDEFVKAGFTKQTSEIVKPARVAESPVQFECKVNDIIELGDQGGAGILIIAQILLIHINETVFEGDKINQHKLKLVGRLGENWYCKAYDSALFEVEKPLTTLGIGIDKLPKNISNSTVLTGNELGQLGNVQELPSTTKIFAFENSQEYKDFLLANISEETKHKLAKKLIKLGQIETALLWLLSK
jgi:flavin reductase (DIM6/NTAB) family NADH-FMN oxidoreductase RutF